MVDTRKSESVPATAEIRGAGAGSVGSRTVFTLSEEETYDLGRALARPFRGGEVVMLQGDLGLGKTVLARGMAAGLGIAPEDVSSPSFTLVQEYRGGRLRMFHVDLYRVVGEEDLETLGLMDLMSSGGVVVVEWGERLPQIYRREAIRIRLHDVGEGSRRIEIEAAEGPSPSAPRGNA